MVELTVLAAKRQELQVAGKAERRAQCEDPRQISPFGRNDNARSFFARRELRLLLRGAEGPATGVVVGAPDTPDGITSDG